MSPVALPPCVAFASHPLARTRTSGIPPPAGALRPRGRPAASALPRHGSGPGQAGMFLGRSLTSRCGVLAALAADTICGGGLSRLSPPASPFAWTAGWPAAQQHEHQGLRRRRQCTSTSASASKGSPECLTSIKGVGAKTAELLRFAGIPDLGALRSWYYPLAKAEPEVVEKSLRDLVAEASPPKVKGKKALTLRKGAVMALLQYLEKTSASVDEQAEVATRGRGMALGDSGLTLCVEGNIGVGKTTFLEKLIGQSLEMQEVVEIVPEPVEKWQSVGDGQVNLLDLFYQDQQRYAYTFQHYVFVTRMMQEKDSRERHGKALRLLERSVFSDRMVFVRAVHEAKCMSDAELSVYDSWFSPMVQAIPTLVPDGFIYLRADPRTCLNRMLGRARSEEAMVSIDYLENLHQKHEDWLGNSIDLLQHAPQGPSTFRCRPTNSPAMPESLRGKLVHLDPMKSSGERRMPSELQSVPALVLDYNIHIDLDNDTEAKREYASQIKLYMEYIKEYKKALANPTSWTPESPGLILPSGNQFSHSLHI